MAEKKEKAKVQFRQSIVVRFSGDSGDGMQLAGNIFSNVSAGLGDRISTFPDYPAEVRAPQGSLGGVSGFQVHIGHGVHTPGDECDVLVAMNPAALKVNAQFLRKGGAAIVDIDTFTQAGLDKALYTTNEPYEELNLRAQVIEAPITTMVKEALKDTGMDLKAQLKCRNMFALGLVCWLFNRPMEAPLKFLKAKFAEKPEVYAANELVIKGGYNYGHNIHATVSTYRIQSDDVRPGTYTDVSGNKATAWGLIMASEMSGRPLFLGSYPITPATDILHELAKRLRLAVSALPSAPLLPVTWLSPRPLVPVWRSRARLWDWLSWPSCPSCSLTCSVAAPRLVCPPRPSRPTCCRHSTAAVVRALWWCSPPLHPPIASRWPSRQHASPLST